MIQAPSTIHMAKREHFQNCVILTPPKLRGLTKTPKSHGPPKDAQCCVVPERMNGPKKRYQMAAAPGFKSQLQSSSVAPFVAPPTIGHSCQHSGEVWPCGVEPIISKFFWTPLQIRIWDPLLAEPCCKRAQLRDHLLNSLFSTNSYFIYLVQVYICLQSGGGSTSGPIYSIMARSMSLYI